MPIYSVDYPSALNFGLLGSLFGQALGSLLDPTGIRFDGRGHLKRMLDVESQKEYDSMLDCLREQYDGYCDQPPTGKGSNQCVNGGDTLNQNLAGLFL